MKKLLEIGINEEMKPYRQDIVWISNLSALVLLFVSVILFVFFAMINPSDLSFVIFPVFVSLFTLVLNAIHLTSLARFVFLAGGSIFFTSLHGYFLLPGQELMNHFLGLQFSFFVLAWLMIDLREPWFLYFTLAILAAIFFCFPFANTYLDTVNDYSIVNSVEYVWTISLVYIAIFLLSAYCIQKRSMFSEKSFLTARETLEEKTKEIQRQEDELKKTLADISKTHKEDDKRSWISTGIADVNSILRVQDDTLYDRLIKGIVKYAGLMYGGIYETEESESEDKYFVLRSCYGFDREKLLKKKYPVNEGILGRVYFERAPVYSVEVTEEYGMIQSGLGETIPGSVYVLPLIHDDKVKGVLEVASFQKMDEKESEFLQRAANVLARFIESYQVNTQSQELLETTQQQNEEMRSQEEEMRQNMEELQATQEELHRKEREYIARIEELESQLKAAEAKA